VLFDDAFPKLLHNQEHAIHFRIYLLSHGRWNWPHYPEAGSVQVLEDNPHTRNFRNQNPPQVSGWRPKPDLFRKLTE
jgi:hypothetical protein